MMMNLVKYLLARVGEQGSMTAYITALMAATADGIPPAGRVALFVIATAKFLIKG
jgi:hypothetical protein